MNDKGDIPQLSMENDVTQIIEHTKATKSGSFQ